MNSENLIIFGSLICLVYIYYKKHKDTPDLNIIKTLNVEVSFDDKDAYNAKEKAHQEANPMYH